MLNVELNLSHGPQNLLSMKTLNHGRRKGIPRPPNGGGDSQLGGGGGGGPIIYPNMDKTWYLQISRSPVVGLPERVRGLTHDP